MVDRARRGDRPLHRQRFGLTTPTRDASLDRPSLRIRAPRIAPTLAPVSSTSTSRGWQAVAAASLLVHLAVIVVVVLVPDRLPPVSTVGVVLMFGSAIPRLLSPWVAYSLTTVKRLLVLRLVGGVLGLVLLLAGAVLD
jgi:hypothetical protein